MALKDWKKIKGIELIGWENKKTGKFIAVRKIIGEGKWEDNVRNSKKLLLGKSFATHYIDYNLEAMQYFTSKPAALKYARAYMRKN